MAKMTIYGSDISGNCLKVKWTADLIGLDYEWRETDILKGQSRTEEFLKLSPAGQIPIVVLEDGRVLEQSCAIILYLAEIDGSDLVPIDSYDRAKMMSWLFWEQNYHEASIAVRRFRKKFTGLTDEQMDPSLLTRGNDSLAQMENHLRHADFFGGFALNLADIVLVAYTRMAGDGGFVLANYPGVQHWITRVEALLGIEAYQEDVA